MFRKITLRALLLLGLGAFATQNANAQVSAYVFSQSSGTYSTVTGGTAVATATAANNTSGLDDNSYSVTLPFTFNINGTGTTSIYVSTNGVVYFGGSGGTDYSSISGTTTATAIAAPFNNDLRGFFQTTGDLTSGSTTVSNVTNTSGFYVGQTIIATGVPAGTTVATVTSNSLTLSAAATSTSTAVSLAGMGDISTSTTGSSPNRTFIIQWRSFQPYNTANSALNFQVRLSEGGGVAANQTVSFVYGTVTGPSSSSAVQVGLRGSASTDYNNRSSTTSWSSTTAGSSNSATVTISSTVSPASGQTFTWTPASCNVPSAVNASAITTTAATIGWTAASPAPASGYQYEVRTSGAAGSGATGLVTSNSTAAGVVTANLTGLTAATTYTVYVRANCGSGNLGNWTAAYTFTTACVAITTLPYVEGFNGGVLPTCWTASVVSGTNNWVGSIGSSAGGDIGAPQSGAGFLSKHYNTSTANLYSPAFNMSSLGTNAARINFWAYKHASTVVNDSMQFFINTSASLTGATALTTIKIKTTEAPVAPSSGWYNYTANIPASFNSAGTVYIIVQGVTTAGGSSYDLGLDSFRLEQAPSCLPSGNATVSAITNNSATITWTASASAPTSGYQYEVRTSGAAGSGATGLVTSNSTGAGVLTANLTGLTPLTNYSVYVRANCGASAGTSIWSSASTFTTACTPPTLSATTPATRCGLGTVNLSAAGTGSTIYWYTTATGGTPVGTTSPFTTPLISATTTYYAAAVNANTYTGLGNTSIPANTGASAQRGIVVQANQNFILNSAQFYSTVTSGTIAGTASLVDNTTGTTITSTPFSFTAAAASQFYTMTLGWNLTAGTTYRLLVQFSSGSVSRISSGADYTLSSYNNLSPVGVILSGYDGAPTSSSYNYFHNISVTGICASARTAVVATVNAAPTATAGSATPSICLGDTATLTATSTNSSYTYTWTPSTTTLTGASVQVAPSATTKYYLNAADNSSGANAGCTAKDSITISVKALPLPLTVTPSSAGILCLGDTLTLTAGGSPGTVATSIFSEDFNGSTYNFTAVNNTTGGTDSTASAWLLKSAPYSYSGFTPINSPSNTNFIMASSDSAGSGNNTDVQLVSPVINTTGAAGLALTFNHFYQSYLSDSIRVDVSTNGGTSWTTALYYTGVNVGTTTSFKADTINLNGYTGQTNFKFRFRYKSIWGYYWAIDDVKLLSYANLPVTWTAIPTTGAGLPTAAGTASVNNVLVKAFPTAVGAYNYKATVTNALGCNRSATTGTITASAKPVVNLGNDTAFCAGNSITLNAGNAGATYSWSTNASTQTISANATGSYRVAVTNTAGCIGRDTIAVTVNALPVVNLGNDTTFCAGNSVALNAGNAGAAYLWSTNATTQSVTAATSGSYSVRVTNTNTCVGRDTVNVTVNPLPVVNLGNDTTFCAPGTLTLSAGNTGATYLWSTQATTQTITASTSGSYSVRVTSPALCIGRDTINVTVRPLPVAGTINVTGSSPTYTFGATGMQNALFQIWNFGDNSTPDSTATPTHTYMQNGTFTVTMYAVDSCGVDSTVATVTVTNAGVGGPVASADVRLFPNPANNTVWVDNMSNQKMGAITVLNAVGAVVAQKQAAGKREQIDLSSLPAGSYLVRIQLDGTTTVRRMQIVK